MNVQAGTSHVAELKIDGDDADVVDGQYQVYLSVVHEWGTPVGTHSSVTAPVAAGDVSVLTVGDMGLVSGDKLLFLDGNAESVNVVSNVGGLVNISPTSKRHMKNVKVVKETLATRDSANRYSVHLSPQVLSSSGVHRLRWRYVKSGETYFDEKTIRVVQQYVDKETFFEWYPELLEHSEQFEQAEDVVKNIINTFCGQSFEFYNDKALTYSGDGHNKIYLSIRLEDIAAVTLKPSYDITDQVEIDPTSKYYLKAVGNSKFGRDATIEIRGNWGWRFVPSNISQASGILIADMFNEDSAYIKHGVIDAYMDTHRIRFDSTIMGTTGNLDADVLLMDYTLFVLGII